MKKDLVSVLLVAIFGTGIAYIVANMFVKEPEPVKYKTVDAASLSSDLIEPDDKVFNPLALNPTVEVYVGGCEEYDVNGECIDSSYYARLLQQNKTKQKEALGYYDEDGYFHKYEYDEVGFYDFYGYYFKFVDDGYEDEDGNKYSFTDEEKGYYDGAEYKNVNNGFIEDIDDEDKMSNEDSDDESTDNDFLTRLRELEED